MKTDLSFKANGSPIEYNLNKMWATILGSKYKIMTLDPDDKLLARLRPSRYRFWSLPDDTKEGAWRGIIWLLRK